MIEHSLNRLHTCVAGERLSKIFGPSDSSFEVS